MAIRCMNQAGREDFSLCQEYQEVDVFEDDWIVGADWLGDLALTYVWTGDHDLAIEILDSLVSIPSRWSVATLRIHPFWEPVRAHPRFEALLARGDKVF